MSEPNITNDPLDCECDACVLRRKKGARLELTQAGAIWANRFLLAALVAGAVAGAQVSLWWSAAAVALAYALGAFVLTAKLILGHPKLLRTIWRAYPMRPVFLGYLKMERELQKAEGGAAPTVLESNGSPNLRIQPLARIPFADMPLSDRVRVETKGNVFGVTSMLVDAACTFVFNEEEGVREREQIWETLAARARELMGPDYDVAETGPLTRRLFDELFTSFVEQARMALNEAKEAQRADDDADQ